jgi:hypothetical protein
VLLMLLREALGAALVSAVPVRIAALAALVAAGLVIFGLMALALGITDWRELTGRRRRQPA